MGTAMGDPLGVGKGIGDAWNFVFNPHIGASAQTSGGAADAQMTIVTDKPEHYGADPATVKPIGPAPKDFLDNFFAANKNKGGSLLTKTGTGRRGTFLTGGADFAPKPSKNPFDTNY